MINKKAGFMTNLRHKKLLEILAGKEVVSVIELSRQLNVTPVTIRTDLNDLERQGKVTRTHGGARVLEERIRQEYTYEQRKSRNQFAKYKIGEAAARLVNSSESILLDASTTVLSMANALQKRSDLKDITVIPTGIWTAMELMSCNDFNILIPGGYLRHSTGSIIGLSKIDFFNNLNIQKAFLGACGISVENGLTDTHLLEIELKKYIISRAKEVTILVDGSKFNKAGISAYASISQISRIITDSTAPETEIKQLHKYDVEIIIAD
jgi:DeoR/GlpR family transcriptional regulator of sugar metabolism